MRDERLFIYDILEQIGLIEKSSAKLSKSEFGKNRDIWDATIRRLEVIGEAVKNISEKTKRKYPQIEWRKIAGTRDVLIHAYFGVHIDAIWKILKKDLIVLKKQIQQIKEDLGKNAYKK